MPGAQAGAVAIALFLFHTLTRRNVLEPTALIFSLHEPAEDGHYGMHTYRGEIRADIDSEDTAFITPCHRVQMSEWVQGLLIEKLEPLGVRYMRWWVDGRLVGRTFGESTL